MKIELSEEIGLLLDVIFREHVGKDRYKLERFEVLGREFLVSIGDGDIVANEWSLRPTVEYLRYLFDGDREVFENDLLIFKMVYGDRVVKNRLLDAGMFYCPRVPLMSFGVVIDPLTMLPIGSKL